MCFVGTLSFASSTWVNSTGSSVTGACASNKTTYLQTIKKNTLEIKKNTADLNKRHNGRIRQYISKTERKNAHNLNNENRKEIKTLHKKLVDQYYANPLSITSAQYVDQMVALRTTYINAVRPLVASGKLADFNTFATEYLTVFKTNRSLRYQNIVARYTAHQSCGIWSIKSSVDSIKEKIEKEHDKYNDDAKKWNQEKQKKKVARLKDQFKKLAEKYEQRWSHRTADIIKTALHDLDEDESDNEPEDKR